MSDRQIKFRAWDEDNEVMYYSDKEYEDGHFGFDEGVVVLWLRETISQTLDETAYDVGKPVKDVMQFTGLLDKNGKGIYEGDIVRYSQSEDFKGHKGVIGFYEAGFRIFRNPNTEFPFDIHIWDAVHYLRLEVIGNVYENSELLKI